MKLRNLRAPILRPHLTSKCGLHKKENVKENCGGSMANEEDTVANEEGTEANGCGATVNF